MRDFGLYPLRPAIGNVGVMHLDRGGLEILDATECRALLASGVIGRIVFTDRALPAVQPVGYALLDGDVIIRIGASSRLSAAVHGTVVAFEADDFDLPTRTGWSVVVVGRAERLTAASVELARLRALSLWPRRGGEEDRYIRVRCELVTGRRILAPDGERSEQT